MECAVQQAIWKSNCIFLPSLLQPFHLNLSSNKATAAAADQLVRSILLYNKAVDIFGISPNIFNSYPIKHKHN